MRNHKLSDMQAKRAGLEDAITGLIHEFEEEMGVRVTEIRIGRMRYVVPSNSQTMTRTVTVARVIVVL